MNPDSQASPKGVGMDPTQVVREVLEQAEEPLSAGQIVVILKPALDLSLAQVEAALDHWRRQSAAAEDAFGKWSWEGPR